MSKNIPEEKSNMKDIVCEWRSPATLNITISMGEGFFLFCKRTLLANKFIENPEQYLNKEAPAAENRSDGATIYTCPMHQRSDSPTRATVLSVVWPSNPPE